MKLIRGLNSSQLNGNACVATIGNFDGLHLGHQKIISKLKDKARELSLPLTVISFEPLPAEFFLPQAPARIYPMRDKVRLLKMLGVDHYLCLNFDNEFAQQAPEDFVQSVLFDALNTKYLAVGDDFRFGNQRKGDFKLLQTLGEKHAMQVVDTPTCTFNNERVSSTRIRKHLEAGELAQANQLLGYPYQLSGRIRHGDKRGRTIGFPTLNLKVAENIAPQRGVYAVKVYGLKDDDVLNRDYLTGVANLGNRPTVNGLENRLETHLFDFDSDVYGKYICVELVEFLRPEQRFEDFNALKAQILNDAEQAKAVFMDGYE